MKGINAELITEFAKDKVWENNEDVFKNQAYLFGKQSFKMSRCRAYRGSKNQRLIDIQKSLQKGAIVLWET